MIIIKNEDNNDNTDNKTQYITKVHSGGSIELDIQKKTEISKSKTKTPHDIHGYLLFNPFK
jgi:hypothetical protein